VATIFPPLAKPRKIGLQCPSIAAAPASAPARWPTTRVAASAGAKPFATFRSATVKPSFGPYTRQTFVAPTLPLPSLRMSTPRAARTTQYPNGRLPAR
jgi:hypothetical protein